MKDLDWHVASPRSQEPPSSRRATPWVVVGRDPLDRLLDLGGAKALRVMVVAVLLTLAFHGAAAARTAYIHVEMIAWALHLDATIDRKLAQQIEIEPEKVALPKVEEEKKIDDTPIEKTEVVKQDSPIAAAKAADIISAKDDDVLDFSHDVFNVGKSDRFSGGATRSDGTNDKAVAAPHVAAIGTGNGGSAQPAVIASVDLSRTATLSGSGEWRCPFPSEADADQVDDAAAVIEVIVGADGKAATAKILQDPGHGFGREARGCAMRESYVPALDRDGKPVASSKKFRVKFER